MGAAEAHQLVDRVTAPDRGARSAVPAAQRIVLLGVIKDCHRLAGWVEARRLAAVAELATLDDQSGSRSTQQDVASAAKTSRVEAERVTKRAEAADLMPHLASALENGEVNTRHLDAAAGVLDRAKPEHREELSKRSKQWGRAATNMSVGEFQRFAAKELRDLEADDGVAGFEQQRRDSRLKLWTDHATGMVMGRFALDPELGARLRGKVHNAVETLFHDRLPDTCPAHPIDRQEHLQALALMELLDGKAASGRPEIIVVLDYETLRDGVSKHGGVRVSGDVDLPAETVRRMACDANLIPAVLGSNGEVLDLGRSARLASAAQRRALRAMFVSCFVPGCDVPFDRCTMHHVQWWERMGASDLANFRPVCTTHHHDLHEGGWLVELDGWWATITLPDGTVMRTGPPSARAA